MANNPQEEKTSIAADEQSHEIAAKSTENSSSLISRIQRRSQGVSDDEKTLAQGSLARFTLNNAATRTTLNRVQRSADRSTVWHPNAGSNPSQIARFTDTIVGRFPDKSSKYQVQRQAPTANSFVFASNEGAASQIMTKSEAVIAEAEAVEEEPTPDIQPQPISLDALRRKISGASTPTTKPPSAPTITQRDAIRTQPNQPAAPAAVRQRPVSRVEEMPAVSQAAAPEEEKVRMKPTVQRQVAPPFTPGATTLEEESPPQVQTKPLVSRAAAPTDEEQIAPKRVDRAAAPEEEAEIRTKPLVSRAAAPTDEEQIAPKRVARAAAPEEEVEIRTKPLVSRAAAPTDEEQIAPKRVARAAAPEEEAEIRTKPLVSRAAAPTDEEQIAPKRVARAAAPEEEAEIRTKPLVSRAAAPTDEEQIAPKRVARAAAPEEEAEIRTKPLVSRAAAPTDEEQIAPKRVARAAAPEEEAEIRTKPLVSRAAAPTDEEQIAPKRVARAPQSDEEEEAPLAVQPKHIARAAVSAEGTPQDEEKASTPLATAASFSPTQAEEEGEASAAVHLKANETAARSSLPLNRSIDLPLTAKINRSSITQRAAAKSTPDAPPLLLHQPVQKQAKRQVTAQRQPLPVARALTVQTPSSQASVQRALESLSRMESSTTSNQESKFPLASMASRSPVAQRQATDGSSVLHRTEESSKPQSTMPAPTPGGNAEALDLDKLARDVYPIIKRMFAIERERSHSRY